jgi:hypothetical protein
MVSQAADATRIRPGIKSHSWFNPDRGIFVFMAALFVATVLVGFIPSSIEKIAAVQSGQRAAFPLVLHVHAVLMGSWILLLLTQVSLVATKHLAIHQRLGLASVALVPAMVVTGFVLVPVTFSRVWGLDPALVPAAAIAAAKFAVSNIALMQIRVGILFPTFVGLALYFRRKDPAMHKRLMILATLMPLPAAIDRIAWLPSSMPASGASPDLYVLLLALPLLVYDLVRHGRISRALLIWVGVSLPLTIPVHLLWGSPWWLATAPRLMGVESW